MLARRAKTDEQEGEAMVTLYLTRDQIANYLGLTLETVSRHFSALKKQGIIAFSDRHSLTVLDLPALQDATGDDGDGAILS